MIFGTLYGCSLLTHRWCLASTGADGLPGDERAPLLSLPTALRAMAARADAGGRPVVLLSRGGQLQVADAGNGTAGERLTAGRLVLHSALFDLLIAAAPVVEHVVPCRSGLCCINLANGLLCSRFHPAADLQLPQCVRQVSMHRLPALLQSALFTLLTVSLHIPSRPQTCSFCWA